MAYRVTWASRADVDLQEITARIACDKPGAADKFYHDIFDYIESAANMPRSGRMVPELQNKRIREWIFKSYRIVYLLNEKEESLVILRIWHGARGTPDLGWS